MAKTMGLMFLLPLLVSLLARSSRAYVESSVQPKDWQASLGLGKEKITHLHFFFHDRAAGKNITAVTVAVAPSTVHSPTFFGRLTITDDPLTEGPDPSSKEVGRAQGMYATVGREEIKLLMAISFSFTKGKFKGSSLSMLSQNPVVHTIREMGIVGGTGLFRLARGIVMAKTLMSTGVNAIVEYHVSVIHYGLE